MLLCSFFSAGKLFASWIRRMGPFLALFHFLIWSIWLKLRAYPKLCIIYISNSGGGLSGFPSNSSWNPLLIWPVIRKMDLQRLDCRLNWHLYNDNHLCMAYVIDVTCVPRWWRQLRWPLDFSSKEQKERQRAGPQLLCSHYPLTHLFFFFFLASVVWQVVERETSDYCRAFGE